MSSIFGFNIDGSAGGDFLAILKYDARSGQIMRMDRIDTGGGNFENNPVIITEHFKAMCDFENLEVGWMKFAPGQAPDLQLVPWGEQLSDVPPTKDHRHGCRFLLKLAKDCGGDRQIREVCNTSITFMQGLAPVYKQYLDERAANPGMLPVLVLLRTIPQKSVGKITGTFFKPEFKIIGWGKRGDLVHVPKAKSNGAAQAQTQTNGTGQAPQQQAQTPPATGSTRASAPSNDVSDFG